MAEEVGFEPTVDFHLRRFSRPVHSTTLPLLRRAPDNGPQTILKARFRHRIACDALFSFHGRVFPVNSEKKQYRRTGKFRLLGMIGSSG